MINYDLPQLIEVPATLAPLRDLYTPWADPPQLLALPLLSSLSHTTNHYAIVACQFVFSATNSISLGTS